MAAKFRFFEFLLVLYYFLLFTIILLFYFLLQTCQWACCVDISEIWNLRGFMFFILSWIFLNNSFCNFHFKIFFVKWLFLYFYIWKIWKTWITHVFYLNTVIVFFERQTLISKNSTFNYLSISLSFFMFLNYYLNFFEILSSFLISVFKQ